MNPGWLPTRVRSPTQALVHLFSSQTLVQLHAFDWKKVDPGWRPDPGWQLTRVHVNGPLESLSNEDGNVNENVVKQWFKL